MKNDTQSMSFENLSINPKLIARIHEMGYTIPTPIQQEAIPVAIEGSDILGIAQTGTGKTLAFAVPLIQRIAQLKGRGLIVVPTRELALQVEQTFAKVGAPFGLRTAVLIGGAPIEKQLRSLKNKPHVIVGTPGRLIDHLERRSLTLETVKVLVLDEADLMFDMGFAPQVNRILESLTDERQTMLFSATMPALVEKIVSSHLRAPVRIEIARSGSTPENITQKIEHVEKSDKVTVLDALLRSQEGSAILFVRTKFGAKKLCTELKRRNHSAAEIHSDRTLAQRRAALDGFKQGQKRILVATDIAARGIDVSGVAFVVNYDMPENPEDYIHRIGRTGRAGSPGHAISFVQRDQRQLLRRVEQLTGHALAPQALKERGDTRSASSSNSARTRGFRKKTSYTPSYGFKKSHQRAPVKKTAVRYITKKKW